MTLVRVNVLLPGVVCGVTLTRLYSTHALIYSPTLLMHTHTHTHTHTLLHRILSLSVLRCPFHLNSTDTSLDRKVAKFEASWMNMMSTFLSLLQTRRWETERWGCEGGLKERERERERERGMVEGGRQEKVWSEQPNASVGLGDRPSN